MDSLTAAVARRQAAEQKEHDAKRAELLNRAKDSSQPESVRRLAALDYDTLGEYQPTVTSNERIAFQEEASAARLALSDLRRTSGAIREAIREAKAELERVKTATALDAAPMESGIQDSVDN